MLSLKIMTACVFTLAVSSPSFAVVKGQITDFEAGTTEGWAVNVLGMGSAPQPTVQPGGPGGMDDHFLLLTSTGSFPAPRLNVLNLTDWTGDYLAAGIAGIRMDVNNLGNTDLALRLMFEDPGVGPPTNIAFSSDPVLLGSGSGWTTVFFPIIPSALTAGMGSIEAALASTTALRLYHAVNAVYPNPVVPIPPIAASLGIDNITAPIPEPASWAMMIVGFGLMGYTIRRRRLSATHTPRLGRPTF